jgi:hypothetical protein
VIESSGGSPNPTSSFAWRHTEGGYWNRKCQPAKRRSHRPDACVPQRRSPCAGRLRAPARERDANPWTLQLHGRVKLKPPDAGATVPGPVQCIAVAVPYVLSHVRTGGSFIIIFNRRGEFNTSTLLAADPGRMIVAVPRGMEKIYALALGGTTYYSGRKFMSRRSAEISLGVFFPLL